MYQMTDREIAEITAMLIIGIAVTGLAMAGFDAARAAGLIAERVAAGIVTALSRQRSSPPSQLSSATQSSSPHTARTPTRPQPRASDREIGRRAIDFRNRT